MPEEMLDSTLSLKEKYLAVPDNELSEEEIVQKRQLLSPKELYLDFIKQVADGTAVLPVEQIKNRKARQRYLDAFKNHVKTIETLMKGKKGYEKSL